MNTPTSELIKEWEREANRLYPLHPDARTSAEYKEQQQKVNDYVAAKKHDYGKEEEPPSVPHTGIYKFQLDGKEIRVDHRYWNGSDIKSLAAIPRSYGLWIKNHAEKEDKELHDGETIDLATPTEFVLFSGSKFSTQGLVTRITIPIYGGKGSSTDPE